MKRALIGVLVASLLIPLSAAGAAPKMKRLGEDPTGDGPPALDVTYLEVGRNGSDVEVRIGIDMMLPEIGGYPELPGVEWIFESEGRTFLAEAFVSRTSGAYLLFEIFEDGSFTQVAELEGTYEAADGYVSVLVPMEMIDAGKGTVLKGAGENDVDSHVHAGPQTYYSDTLTTEKAFKIR